MALTHKILRPIELEKVHGIAQDALTQKHGCAINPTALIALIEDLIALRCHVLHLLPLDWDQHPGPRDSVAHLRSTCTREIADDLMLRSGLIIATDDQATDDQAGDA